MAAKITVITKSTQETINFAEKVGRLLRKGDVVAYRGGLGAGKTAFTRGLAKGLGLNADEVTSPTFAIVNEYRGAINVCHFDMYRITDISELESTGFYDYPLEESVFAVEWSENIADALDTNTIYITLERIDDDTRKIIIEGDDRFADLGA